MEIGKYVLFQQQGSSSPPWPSVICPDDFAPRDVARARPNGYYHLVLVINPKPQFRYALSTELRQYEDPSYEELQRVNGLKRAVQLLCEAVGCDDELGFWKAITEDQRSECPTFQHDDFPTLEDSDSDSDLDIKEAKRLSRLDMENWKRALFPTPPNSLSPPAPRKSLPGISHPPTPMRRNDIRSHFHSDGHLPVRPGAEIVRPCQPPTVAAISSQTSRRLTQAKDVIDGEISESEDFVEFLVGQDRERFFIPMKDIENRPYFVRQHEKSYSGYLRAKGDKTWAIDMPCLAKIDPDDFRYIAEFISTNDFGIRVVEDDNRDEALAECVAAWAAADQLGMEDLLEHIVKKLRMVMPWTSGEVLAFATVVYRTEGAPLDGHEQMKQMLSEYMVENYDDMVEEHGRTFLSRIGQMPELQHTVYHRLAEKAKQRMEDED